MSLAFTNLSSWLWSSKKQESKLENESYINSSTELNVLEVDVLKHTAVSRGNLGNLGTNSKRVRRKWANREEGKIDKEHDVVLVPSDGGCSSDYESDGSDWSIGWSEPHAPGFLSDDEIDAGFGVLVPCYGSGRGSKRGQKNNVRDNIAKVEELYSAESKKNMEQWLSTLQGS